MDKLKINRDKKYEIKELESLLWSAANSFHGGGKINNGELQNVAIPTIFLKRILDLRQDYIEDTENGLKSKPTFKMSKNLTTTLESEYKNINKAFNVINNDVWFFITYQDIINFTHNNTDAEEIEIELEIDGLKLKTTAKDRIGFIKEIYNNISHNTVKSIFHESRFFDHYLEDRRKMDIEDVEKLFNKFAGEFFGNNVKTDMFSTAYIFLISKFASGAGSKGGEFFTPDVICRTAIACLQPTLNKKGKTKVCDITSGSATFAIEFGNYLVQSTPLEEVNDKIEFYLQEKEGQTLVLGEAGLLLTGFENLNAFHGNTLLNYNENIGQFRTMMDYFVGNPPYGVKILQKDDYEKILRLEEPRWDYGYPPKSELEWFFVQTALDMLSEKGKGMMVLPLGVLFKKNSRKLMIEEDIIEGIVTLPGNMFQTTGIPTCMVFFNKNKDVKDKNKIFMINNSEDFVKVDKYNTIDHDKLIKNYIERITEEGFSGYIEFSEVKENDFNVSTQRYIFKDEPEEIIDIVKLNDDSIVIDKSIKLKGKILGSIFDTVIALQKSNIETK
jgi:type I restriction enzyme M protein